MNSTIFLAQIWGPILLSLGVGILISPNFYKIVYRDIEKEPLAVLMFGIISITAAIAQIKFHNSFNSLASSVITLLGILLLIKGLAMIISPKLVDLGGDFDVKSKLLPASAAVVFVLGLYLSYIGFWI